MGGTSQAVPFLTALASLAQNIATHYLGRRLSLSEFDNLLKSSGDQIFDGDDEDDNVVNTQATYSRLNLIAFAEAILQLDSGSNATNPPQPDPNGDANDLSLTTTSFSHSGRKSWPSSMSTASYWPAGISLRSTPWMTRCTRVSK